MDTSNEIKTLADLVNVLNQLEASAAAEIVPGGETHFYSIPVTVLGQTLRVLAFPYVPEPQPFDLQPRCTGVGTIVLLNNVPMHRVNLLAWFKIQRHINPEALS